MDGETARIILDNTPTTAAEDRHHHSTGQSVPLQIRSVGVSSSDSMIQVLVFEPQNLINRLSKMEKLSKEVPKKKKEMPKRQTEAFKTYLMARRQFGAGKYMYSLSLSLSSLPLFFSPSLPPSLLLDHLQLHIVAYRRS